MCLLVAVATLTPGFSAAGEVSARAQQVHSLVMEKVPAYQELNQPKVMAICINWHFLNAYGFYVHNLFVTYLSSMSDVQMFIGKLANDAKQKCKRWRKSADVDCSCTMLDMNGRNVLDDPGNCPPGAWANRSRAVAACSRFSRITHVIRLWTQ